MRLKELRAESLSTSADLMYLSRQSEVYRLVREKGLNLEELKTPPYKLLVDKK
ncbi:MAG: FtsL-like putative cell division protein [Marinilabiliales bacterium]|nr:FtsL-like putative cell division protein [Marinilabiliales bacterium]